MQKACRVNDQVGNGNCSILKQLRMGVMFRFPLLTEVLAVKWESGRRAEETAFSQPPIMRLVGKTAQFIL